MQRRWRGNVRELENLCQRLTVMAPGRVIDVADLLPETPSGKPLEKELTANHWQLALAQVVTRKITDGQQQLLEELGPQFERVLLSTALTMTHGRKQRAAELLGWGRNTLTRKLKLLNLD